MSKYFTNLSAVLAISLMSTTAASAAVLLDQQPNGGLFVDQEFDDNSDFSTYMVDDVTFAGNVRITSVTTYFSASLTTPWPANGSAILNIFQGASLDASDDPSSGGDFGNAAQSVSITNVGGGITEVVASGLNILLSAGTYWFGLTPDIPISSGQEFHSESTTTNGSVSQFRNPNGGFGLGTDWLAVNTVTTFGDMALTIEGDRLPTAPKIPLPAGLPLILTGLGAFGFLARRHRG